MGTVLNWIAQGVIVAAATAIGLWLLPAGRARARVWVWWTVVAVVICLPLVTWWAPTAGAPLTAAGALEPLVTVPQPMWHATSVVAAAWIAWICLQTMRLCLDLRALARTRLGCRAVSASVERRLRPSTRARLAKLDVRLMVSCDVKAAAVLGFGPPIIAVQPALVEQLTDAELDQVMVHEWAHVARRDAFGTLVQRLVHVAAGWHPAVWFAMGRLRMEREMACDEVVVDATGSAKAYAACLTRVAGLAQASRGSHLAIAMLSSPSLTRRVMRLLARGRAPAFAPYWMVAPAALAVVVAFATGQVSLFGVQLTALPLIEMEIRAADLMVAPRVTSVAATVAPARTPAASARHSRRQDVVRSELPVASALPGPPSAVPTIADASPTIMTSTVEPVAEPTAALRPMPAPDALAKEPTAPETAAPTVAASVTTEAKDAWATATQVGESIGRSSRKGAVSTAGFFTRISKRVATSF